jgi:uncharacterized membrane protein YgdD (TMEM256/DUF423 family)
MITAPEGPRPSLLAAGLLGFTGVGLGALGAHALKARLTEAGMLQAWDTASRYHLFHALALLALAAWSRADSGAEDNRLAWIRRSWCAGVVLFSGSLYGLALGGPRWLGPITPLGGILLMFGWLFIGWTALRPRR